jgi:hypothetical protein
MIGQQHVGRAIVREADMAEAADSPAGWTRDVTCVLEREGRRVSGDNGQVPASCLSAAPLSFSC